MHKHNYSFITSSLRSEVYTWAWNTQGLPDYTFWNNCHSPRGESQGNHYHLFLCPERGKISEHSLLASGMKGNLQSWPCFNSCSKDSCAQGWRGFGCSRYPESAGLLVSGSAVSGRRVTCWTPSYFLLNGSKCLRKFDPSPQIQAGPLTVNIINPWIRVRNICNSLPKWLYFMRSSPHAIRVLQGTGSKGISFLIRGLIPLMQNDGCCSQLLSVASFIIFFMCHISFSTGLISSIKTRHLQYASFSCVHSLASASSLHSPCLVKDLIQ